MTIGEVIDLVDTSHPNAFSKKQKVRWLAELDGKIAVDLMRMHPSQLQAFRYGDADMDKELLVVFPHDDIYPAWLGAKIDEANGEYNKYANSMEVYNGAYDNFACWFLNTYQPGQGYEEGYYG